MKEGGGTELAQKPVIVGNKRQVISTNRKTNKIVKAILRKSTLSI